MHYLIDRFTTWYYGGSVTKGLYDTGHADGLRLGFLRGKKRGIELGKLMERRRVERMIRAWEKATGNKRPLP